MRWVSDGNEDEVRVRRERRESKLAERCAETRDVDACGDNGFTNPFEIVGDRRNGGAFGECVQLERSARLFHRGDERWIADAIPDAQPGEPKRLRQCARDEHALASTCEVDRRRVRELRIRFVDDDDASRVLDDRLDGAPIERATCRIVR